MAYGYGASSLLGLLGNGLVSFLPIVIAVVVIVVVLAAISGRGNRGSPLVLKDFRLDENADVFLIIKGRASGLLSWILSLCGIDPVTSLTCNKQAVKFETSAIRYGKETKNIPLFAVTCVSSGINKPFALLVLGIVFGLGGIIGAIFMKSMTIFFIGVVIGAVFLLIYHLNKSMRFSIYNGGDKPIATIILKKSIIEGQNIDASKYESAASVLNKAVLNAIRQNNGA